jgi:hypothetical protein
MDAQEQEDPVVGRWLECVDCGWKTREYGPHEEVPTIATCPYCTYGGDVVVKTRTASEALAKVDFMGRLGSRPASSPGTENEDTRSGGE